MKNKVFIEDLYARLVNEGIPVQTVIISEDVFRGETLKIGVNLLGLTHAPGKTLESNLSFASCTCTQDIKQKCNRLISELKNEYQTCLQSPDR